jgi:UDP-sulfoquinovose synthase
VRCVKLAVENPPVRGERVKIFNQATETHRVGELAELVASLTGAELRYYVNPRNEAPENELIVRNDQFLALGLDPITLKEGLLEEVVAIAADYKDRVNFETIVPSSAWRADIKLDGTGYTEPVNGSGPVHTNGHTAADAVAAPI